jgi:hypothetical protein
MDHLDAPAAYIRLALTINRLLPGYVESYYGPPELRASAEAGENPSASDLQALADSLRLALEMDGALTSVFEDSCAALDKVLPGSGPLPRRIADFRERSRIPAGLAARVMEEVAGGLRGRARSLFALPEPEECETEFVYDRPWFAFNWFMGNSRSRIQINQDLPMEAWGLPGLMAHEAYPGHHTECSIKEEVLFKQGGLLEHSIWLSNAPSALVSEGIAMNALEAVASPEETVVMLRRCYQASGLLEADAERAYDFMTVSKPLDKVIDNQVLLLFREGASEDEFIAYGLRYSFQDEAEQRHLLRFLKDPLSRSYSFNYTLGYDLIRSFLGASPDRTRAFARLLSEPLTPHQLEQSTPV